MAFRYINPGYGETSGDTFESFIFNPQNGVSFQKLGTASQNEMKIITSQAFTTDIYGKFNLYFDSTGNFSRFSIGGVIANSVATYLETIGIGIYSWNNRFYLYDNGSQFGTGLPINKKSLNSIWFHLNKNDEQKITSGELIVNDSEGTFTSSKPYYSFSPESFFYVSFPRTNGQYIYLSEIIISNEFISPEEKIISLPTSSLETNMTPRENGIYIANVANQTLLQNGNVSSLIESDATLAITGISIVSNPAYKIGAGVANLTALSKVDSYITTHDTITLSGNSTAIGINSWGLSSIDIEELRNIQVGWKVGV